MELIDIIKERSQNKGIKLPKGISFELKENVLFLSVSSKGVISNMQTDDSAFEGWSICLKALLNDLIESVVLSWYEPTDNADKKEMIHYNRFLFRVCLFKDHFSWFSVDKKHDKNLEEFKKRHTNLVVNYPKTESKEHVTESDKINKGEAKLERTICRSLQNKGIADHQLPVGLFDNFVHTDNTCTPRAASQIDLWALNKEELSVYELKDKKNNSVGIITELMFYANVMNLLRKHIINYPKEIAMLRDPKRHISELYHAIENNEITKVNAIFLTFELHPLFEYRKNEVLALINNSMNSQGIHFSCENTQSYLN